MLAYCQLDSWEQITVKFKKNAFEIIICQNGGHFVQGRWFLILKPHGVDACLRVALEAENIT